VIRQQESLQEFLVIWELRRPSTDPTDHPAVPVSDKRPCVADANFRSGSQHGHLSLEVGRHPEIISVEESHEFSACEAKAGIPGGGAFLIFLEEVAYAVIENISDDGMGVIR